VSNIVIDIAAEFTGKGAFKKAENSTDKLTKGVKSLAKTLGVAFGTQQILAYGKAAVKAAAEDEKAQKQLALALKNVGLGRQAAASEGYIQKLQKEYGILDDNLRPAYQTLAVATRSTTESQKLLLLAMDISASKSIDLGVVTKALSKAYLGNTTALGKLDTGISKADLKTKSFAEITAELSKTFAGSATASANTFQGSMDKLAVSSANAQEIIGEGLINSIKILGEDSSVTDLATGMEEFATAISESIQGLAILIAQIKSIGNLPGGASGAIFDIDKLFKFTMIPYLRSLAKGANQGSANDPAAGLAHLAELEAKYTAATLKTSKKLTAEELKQLKAKQLKAAIDKANLALDKGAEVFDLERIGLQAAELNQAAQLSKVTNQAQLLQITNDLARLQVKQSILDLDKAIASQDIAAITAATNQLNADLKVLGVLTNQKIKLTEIETILKGILPKDLINLTNLNEALALLSRINGFGGGGMASHANPILSDPNASPKGFPTGAAINDALANNSFVPIVPGTGGVYGGSGRAGNYPSYGYPGSDMGYAGGSTYVDITINAGFGTDPEELARVVENVFNQSTDRGTSTNRSSGVYVS
jgi:phage FluMu protein gp41